MSVVSCAWRAVVWCLLIWIWFTPLNICRGSRLYQAVMAVMALRYELNNILTLHWSTHLPDNFKSKLHSTKQRNLVFFTAPGLERRPGYIFSQLWLFDLISMSCPTPAISFASTGSSTVRHLCLIHWLVWWHRCICLFHFRLLLLRLRLSTSSSSYSFSLLFALLPLSAPHELKCLSTDTCRKTGPSRNEKASRPSEFILDSRHIFQEYTYKKVTPCDVCSQILRGERAIH